MTFFKRVSKLFETRAPGGRIGIRESNPEDGCPLHDLTFNGVYPHDVYKKGWKQYGPPDDDVNNMTVFSVILQAKDKPNKKIKVYKPVVEGVDPYLEDGDLVSPLRSRAEEVLREAGDGKVVGYEVSASSLFTGGRNWFDWRYYKREYDRSSSWGRKLKSTASRKRFSP